MGTSDHINKPFELEALYSTLIEWIDPATLRQSLSAPPPASEPTEDASELRGLPGIDLVAAAGVGKDNCQATLKVAVAA